MNLKGDLRKQQIKQSLFLNEEELLLKKYVLQHEQKCSRT